MKEYVNNTYNYFQNPSVSQSCTLLLKPDHQIFFFHCFHFCFLGVCIPSVFPAKSSSPGPGLTRQLAGVMVYDSEFL
jgi:hypothetical protein